MSLLNIVKNLNYLPQEVNTIEVKFEDFIQSEIDPHLNAAFFGANSMKHLFEIEERKKFLVDRPRRRKRRDKKGGGNSIECNFKIKLHRFWV